MKRLSIIAIFFALLSFGAGELFAQIGSSQGAMGSHGSRGRDFGGTGMQSTPEKIDFVSMTGLFDIDSKEVVKRVKITNEATQRGVHIAIAAFVLESGEISTLHATEIMKITAAEEALTKIQDQAESGQEIDRSYITTIMSNSREAMSVVRLKVAPIHKEMNEKIVELLKGNEKQLKKWESYYRNLCNEHRFNANMPTQEGGAPQTGGGRPMGGGSGGGSGGGRPMM